MGRRRLDMIGIKDEKEGVRERDMKE